MQLCLNKLSLHFQRVKRCRWQVWQYLEGQDDYQTMVDRGVAATRQLAKRQITWLRGWKDLVELDANKDANLDKIVYRVSVPITGCLCR